MMFSRHILCGLLATAAPALQSLGVAREADAPAVADADNVAAAYTTLRQWTDAFELPKPADAASYIHIDGATGVCVIVRRSGRMLGSGADSTGDNLMLRRAAAHALGETLSDGSVSALPESLRNAIGPSLTVELEVAGRLTPLVGRDLAQMAARIEPGLDGIAIRRGRKLFALFPSQMRATNTAGDPAARLISLAMQAGLDAPDIARLTQLNDVTVFSFRTTHLIQPTPGKSPLSTFRGDIIVPNSAVSAAAVVELADGLAAHLMASMFPDPAPAAVSNGASPAQQSERNPVGVMGAYRPVADAYEPLIAPPAEQALAAMALLRYAQSPQIEVTKAAAAAAVAKQILLDLREVTVVESPPLDDPAAAAAIVYAIAQKPALRDDAAIASLFNESTATLIAHTQKDEPLSPHAQAIVAGALARLLTLTDPPAGASSLPYLRARAALDRAWQSVPAHQHIALLPWIGWGEVDFARAADEPLAHEDDLRVMRDTLARSRIRADSGAPVDLIGGFSLTTTAATLDRPTADAQTVRPAAWLASIIRDERFTSTNEAVSALADHLQTIRFIMQLTAREPVLATCRNPDRARGGIRAAPWDFTQPVPAQALALIMAVQTLQSMEKQAATP